jgi:hypothetical protein
MMAGFGGGTGAKLGEARLSRRDDDLLQHGRVFHAQPALVTADRENISSDAQQRKPGSPSPFLLGTAARGMPGRARA